MKTQQTPDNSKRHITATKDKIYWRDLPADSQVTEAENAYYCEGKLVYWHGHEVRSASLWLNTHLAATATPAQASGSCQTSHSPLPRHALLPWVNNGGRIEIDSSVCVGITVATVGRVNDQTPQDTANARHIVRACNNAQRLADALNRAVARLDYLHKQDVFHCKDWDAITQAREALAQWEKESPADADALEALDQLEAAQDE